MDVIKLTEELIEKDSRNPFDIQKAGVPNKPSTWIIDGNETKIAKHLENKLKEAGFHVDKQSVHKNRDGIEFYNLIAEKGCGDKSILFYGHMDTVTADPWLSEDDALTPKRENREGKEVIVGLGSNDMKAGLSVITTAFNNVDPKGYKIKVAFGVDEEYYSLGANVLAESDFVKDVKAIVIPETGDGPNTCYGPGTITLGRLGRCEYVIKVPGTGGHGAQSLVKKEEFVNSAVECSKITLDIEKLRGTYEDKYIFFKGDVPDKKAKKVIDGSLFVNRIEAGKGSLSIPAEGKVIVDVTMTLNKSSDEILKMLRERIDEMYRNGELRKFKISGKPQRVAVEPRGRPTLAPSNAFITPEDHLFTQYVRGIVDEVDEFKNYQVGFSVADENVFDRELKGIPILSIGPIGEDCHKANEWVEIESIKKLQKVYSEIGERFGEYLPKC